MQPSGTRRLAHSNSRTLNGDIQRVKSAGILTLYLVSSTITVW